MVTKETPPSCRLLLCPYNSIAPPADSQECIGCQWLKPKNSKPKKRVAP